MSNITAENIKMLREKAGAGMMDCKKALLENNGDINQATSWLRKKVLQKLKKIIKSRSTRFSWFK